MENAKEAYDRCVENGGVGVQPPVRVSDRAGRGSATISEVHAYGDVVLRFISFGGGSEGVSGEGEEEGEGEGEGGSAGAGGGEGVTSCGGFRGAFLPNFVDVEGGGERENFGLERADHIVGNVWDMVESVRETGVSGGVSYIGVCGCVCRCVFMFCLLDSYVREPAKFPKNPFKIL